MPKDMINRRLVCRACGKEIDDIHNLCRVSREGQKEPDNFHKHCHKPLKDYEIKR